MALAVCETKCTLTILKLAGMSDNSKVRESSVSTHMHLQSAARHELLDNVEAGGHALGGVGLHAPHPLELHNMPAICLYILGHTNVLLADNPVLGGSEAMATHWMSDTVVVVFTTRCSPNT